MVVDSGCTLVNYHTIEISSSESNCLIEAPVEVWENEKCSGNTSLRSLAVTNLSALKQATKPQGAACPDDLHFLLPPPITYFVNMMTGFVDRIIPANHSAGRNIKLPICREMDSQGKATVKHIKTVLSDAVFARWRQRAICRKSLSKVESIEMEKRIVDFVVVCLKSNSENLRKPLTFHRRIFSRFLNVIDFKMTLCPKSAQKSTLYLIMCAMPVLGKLETLLNFTISSTRACSFWRFKQMQASFANYRFVAGSKSSNKRRT